MRGVLVVLVFVAFTQARSYKEKSDVLVETLREVLEESKREHLKETIEKELQLREKEKRDQKAKEEVEAFVNDFFENGCNDQTFDEYFTDDARVNYAGILSVGRDKLKEVETEDENLGVTCQMENFNIKMMQVQGDSAIALVEETDEIEAGDNGHVVEEFGNQMIAVDSEEETLLVACELVKKNGKWLFSVQLYFQEKIKKLR